MENWVILLYLRITEVVDYIGDKLNTLQANKEEVSNKVTNLDNPDNITYPTTAAVKEGIDSAIEGIPKETPTLDDVATKGNTTTVKLTGSENFSEKEPEDFAQMNDIDQYKIGLIQNLYLPDYEQSLDNQLIF